MQRTPSGGERQSSVADPEIPPRVLVVEDNIDMQQLLSRTLKKAGFSCETAADGIEGLGWAMATPFDLIVTDMHMPRVDGLQLIGRLRRSRMLSGTALVVMTANADYEERAKALNPDAFLRKPFPPQTLVETARRVLEGWGRTRQFEPETGEPPADEKVFSRSLDAIRPAEICKIMHTGRRSGRLHVNAEDGSEGVIELRGGEVHTAELRRDGELVSAGETAVAAIFQLRSGQLSLEILEGGGTTRRGNIHRPTPRVLAEAAGKSPGDTGEWNWNALGPFRPLETLWKGPHVAAFRVQRAGARASDQQTRLLVEHRVPPELRPLEALQQLEGPGFVRLLAWGELADGRQWYESDLPRGRTLRQLMGETGSFPIADALQLFEHVLDTLSRGHARGLAHGGLDARRIVLPGIKERPLLLDYGRTHRGSGPEDRIAVYTAPPEVWQGHVPDARSDLYSAGVLLFHALSGRYPFESENPLKICHDHLARVPPTLSDVGVTRATPELEEVVARLLAKDPTERFSGAGVARTALERARLHLAAQASEEDFGVPAPGGYRFLHKIGEGGGGMVFEAIHETLEKRVAVKVIRPDLSVSPIERRRFLQEARLAASLVHPGVVQVSDAREEGGLLYLVMEYVDGESLAARLQREGALQESEAISVARGALEALAAAHERGIIHLDVKPANILLTPDGRVKVADFGLAVSLAYHEPGESNLIEGTPLFMSPEQCLGRPPDARSDLYSLGTTMYAMLAGRPPFADGTIRSVIWNHVNKAPQPVVQAAPDTTPALGVIVDRLLAKAPEQRYSSAREVVAALADCEEAVRAKVVR